MTPSSDSGAALSSLQNVSTSDHQPSRKSRSAFIFVLATMPVSSIAVPIPHLQLPLTYFASAIYLITRLRGCRVQDTFMRPPGTIFWAAISTCLVVLLAHSCRDDSVLSPWYFLARMFVLATSVLIAKETSDQWRSAELGHTLTQASLLSIGIILCHLLVGMFVSGVSPSVLFLALQKLDFEQYLWGVEAILSGRTIEDVAVNTGTVLRNTFAEGILYLIVLMTASTMKHRALKIAIRVFLIMMLVTLLSRSSLLGLVFVGLWATLPIALRRPGLWLLVPAMCVAVELAINGSELAQASLHAFSENRSQSNSLRIDQYRMALSHHHTSVFHLFFGDGIFVKYTGFRIHNLVLSSWVEGGIVSVIAVLIGYERLARIPIGTLWRAFRGSVDHQTFLLCAIPVLAMLKTLTGGGGGFYAPSALISLGLVWGITESGHPRNLRVDMVTSRDK